MKGQKTKKGFFSNANKRVTQELIYKKTKKM